MSNASLKEQLQAVASNFNDTSQPNKSSTVNPPANTANPKKPKHKIHAKNNTAEENRPRWLEYILYGLELLKITFPNCFKEGHEIKPLKIGIKEDLVKHLSGINTIVTDDKACMLKSLVYYVNTMSYHRTIAPGVERIDLQGKVSGTVTAEESQYSKERQLLKQSNRQKKNPSS